MDPRALPVMIGQLVEARRGDLWVCGRLVEVQGTGEEHSFSREELDRMLDLAQAGIARLAEIQNEALATTMAEVDAARSGDRRSAPPKDERDLWGPP